MREYASNKRLFDPTDQHSKLSAFPEHALRGIELGAEMDLSGIEGRTCDNIIICGMGGSAISGDLFRSLASHSSPCPVMVWRDYGLPAFVNERSLIVVMSYSGTTEESLSSYEEACRRKAAIVAITSGGDLLRLVQQRNQAVCIIPGGLAPRAALGYLCFPLLMIMHRFSILTVGETELRNAVEGISGEVSNWSRLDARDNRALALADRMRGKVPFIYTSGTFEAVGIRWKCQIQENAKTLAHAQVFPELNHNEIVGWENQSDVLNSICVVFLGDRDDHPRITKRMHITREMIQTRAGDCIELESERNTLLERMFSMVCLGDWVSYFLAIGSETDPYPIVSIETLKKALAAD